MELGGLDGWVNKHRTFTLETAVHEPKININLF